MRDEAPHGSQRHGHVIENGRLAPGQHHIGIGRIRRDLTRREIFRARIIWIPVRLISIRSRIDMPGSGKIRIKPHNTSRYHCRY
jgi:hypothetical protein